MRRSTDRPKLKTGIPAGPGIDWPFRVDGEYFQRFDQRSKEWVTQAGARDSAGYHMISWKSTKGRVFKRAHIVCWETHNGPVPDGLEIDHIDGNKSNNNITNLRLVTHHENMLYARERLGNWAEGRLKAHQLDLILALPPGCRAIRPLAERWGYHPVYLASLRVKAKAANDPRYLGGL